MGIPPAAADSGVERGFVLGKSIFLDLLLPWDAVASEVECDWLMDSSDFFWRFK